MKVKIIGAGSIGNHLAQASRRIGWEVTVIDNDPKALERMKNEIYPTRYGSWDEEIRLFLATDELKGSFDIIMIGTPPDSHIKLALETIKESPRLIHIEKPLCTPLLEQEKELAEALAQNPQIIVTVGYDHAVAKSIEFIVAKIKEQIFGEVVAIDVEFREHWGGIFGAHPWLAGPWESYLGYWRRGGGAGNEHSHAMHLWFYLAKAAGWQGVKEVKAGFDFQKDGHGCDYDQLAAFIFKDLNGHLGRVIQDVVTKPTRKWLRVQGSEGYIEWYCNGAASGGDLVRYQLKGQAEVKEEIFDKKRPDDFYQVVTHYQALLDGSISAKDSPLHFDCGLEVMKILNQSYPTK